MAAPYLNSQQVFIELFKRLVLQLNATTTTTITKKQTQIEENLCKSFSEETKCCKIRKYENTNKFSEKNLIQDLSFIRTFRTFSM